MSAVSIIVPIYNSGKYLEPCLESIQNQVFSDFEVICVNDASEDNSVEIINKFLQNDSRMHLIMHEKREGAANARNHGFEYATSPYVVFWDADEIYVSDLLQQMYDAAVQYDADLILAERGIIKNDQDHVDSEASRRLENCGYDKKVFNLFDLPINGFTMWPSCPVNRMVRKEIIDKNNLRYQSLKSANDVLFADMSMIYAKRIIHIKEWEPKIYVRRNIPGSISENRDPFCSYRAFKEIKSQLLSKGMWEVYKNYVINHFLIATSVELMRCKSESVRKEYYQFLQREGIKDICEDNDINFFMLYTSMGHFLNNLLEQPYEKKCWERSQFFGRLEENKEKLGKLLAFFKKMHWKVALWGAGRYGKDTIRYFREVFSYEFDYLIDNNEKLHNKVIEGNVVSDFHTVKSDIDIVVITNVGYKEDIEKQIMKENAAISIFLLPQYLGEDIFQCIENYNLFGKKR